MHKTVSICKRAAYTRSGVFIISLLCFCAVVVGLMSDTHMRHVLNRWYIDVNHYAGTMLDDIYLEGSVRSERKAAEDIIRPYVGKPLLSAPIYDIKKKMEALPWVDLAVVERMFPSAVMIRITEHRPVAIWQQGRKFYVINASGEIVEETDDYRAYGDIMLVAGDGAAERLKSFMAMLSAHPRVLEKVVSASFVGERRWDVFLKNGLLIRLPEDNPQQKISIIDDMIRQGNLDNRPIKTVNMILDTRMFIELKSGETEYFTE